MTFPAGVTHVSFVVVITNDNVLEGKEKFSLFIDPFSLLYHRRVTVGNPNQVTVTLYDDDGNWIVHLLAVV